MTKTKRAVFYARVSTEEQAKEGFSIQAQVEEIRAYANTNNMQVVDEYIDEGASGKSISGRPQMKRLLENLRDNTFDVVIIYKIDRIARKSKDAMEIADLCDKANVSLLSLKENFDMTTPMGYVFDELSRIASQPVVLKRIVEKVNEQRAQAQQPVSEEIKVIQSKLKRVETRTDNITEELMDDPSLVSIFKPKLEALTAEKMELQQRIEQLNVGLSACDTKPIDFESLKVLLNDLETTISKADTDQQKALFRTIISEILVSKEAPRPIGRQVNRIILHFDFTMDAMLDHHNPLLSSDLFQPVEPWMFENMNEEGYRDFMKSRNILPLTMVRFPPINPKSPINLLHEYQPH